MNTNWVTNIKRRCFIVESACLHLLVTYPVTTILPKSLQKYMCTSVSYEIISTKNNSEYETIHF